MGNPDKIVAVGLGEVLYDHDVVTDEYTFGGAPANFADHFRSGCGGGACGQRGRGR